MADKKLAFAGIKGTEKPKQILVGRKTTVYPMFRDKTVKDVADENGLGLDDIDFIKSSNGITSFLMIIDGTEYLIPVSNGLLAQYEESDNFTLAELAVCEFRESMAKVYEKNSKGESVVSLDENDEEIKAPYLNLGKPGGVVEYERENTFAEQEEVEKPKGKAIRR